MSFETFELIIHFIEKLLKALKSQTIRNALISLCEAIESQLKGEPEITRAAIDLRKALQADAPDAAELIKLGERLVESGREDLEDEADRLEQEEITDLPEGWDEWREGGGQ